MDVRVHFTELKKKELTRNIYSQHEKKTMALSEERFPVVKHSIMTLSVYNIIDSCEKKSFS